MGLPILGEPGLHTVRYGIRAAFAALGPKMTEPGVGVGTVERFRGNDQGKGIPCSVERIPCSRGKIPCSAPLREFDGNPLKLPTNSVFFAKLRELADKALK